MGFYDPDKSRIPDRRPCRDCGKVVEDAERCKECTEKVRAELARISSNLAAEAAAEQAEFDALPDAPEVGSGVYEYFFPYEQYGKKVNYKEAIRLLRQDGATIIKIRPDGGLWSDPRCGWTRRIK